MVALNFDNPVFNRTSHATHYLKGFGQVFELGILQRYTGNTGNALAVASGGFAADADYAVACRTAWGGWGFFDSASVGGIDQAGIFAHGALSNGGAGGNHNPGGKLLECPLFSTGPGI